MPRKKSYCKTRKDRVGYKTNFVSPENGEKEDRCKQVFAEIIALALDAVSFGIALEDLDPRTLTPLSTGERQLPETRMQRRLDAIESAAFIRGPAAADICDGLNISQQALYRRARQLAAHKAQRVAQQQARDRQRKERRLALNKQRRIKASAEAEMRRLTTK